MKRLLCTLSLVLGASACIGIHALAAPLASDDFSSAQINPAYTAVNGEWIVKDGVVSQISMEQADPTKLIFTGKEYPADVQITAKVRIDEWIEHDMARAGVSLRSNIDDGNGYNMLFHQDHERVQFLDDKTAWGEYYDFTWEDNVWYWFKMKIEGDVISGKVWKDGTPEPTDWPFIQDSWVLDREGAPALNGGSSDGENGALASFDDVMISAPDK